MKSPMQIALAEDWAKLPPALQAHYAGEACIDHGHLDIDYPVWMQTPLSLLYALGALVNQRGRGLATEVRKEMRDGRQHWQRRIALPNGVVKTFNSQWLPLASGEVEEYVNRFLALRMRPTVREGRLHYAGCCYVLRLGRLRLTLPECLVLGHTTIEETARGTDSFAMDFRLTHPLFGQIYRYSGVFHTRLAAGTSGKDNTVMPDAAESH